MMKSRDFSADDDDDDDSNDDEEQEEEEDDDDDDKKHDDIEVVANHNKASSKKPGVLALRDHVVNFTKHLGNKPKAGTTSDNPTATTTVMITPPSTTSRKKSPRPRSKSPFRANQHNKIYNNDQSEENLDDMLASVEIDSRPFTLDDNSTSDLRMSKNDDNDRKTKDDHGDADDVADIIFHTNERDEVFSKRYRVSKDEENTVKELESVLSIHKTLSNRQQNDKVSFHDMSLRDQWDTIVHPMTATESKPITSILLKADMIPYASWTNIYMDTLSSRVKESTNGNRNEIDTTYEYVELYLFPRGLIIVYVYPETTMFFIQKYTPRRVYQCIYFDLIQFVTIIPSKRSDDENEEEEQHEHQHSTEAVESSHNESIQTDKDPNENKVFFNQNSIVFAAEDSTSNIEAAKPSADVDVMDEMYYIQMEWKGYNEECITIGFDSIEHRDEWLMYLRKTILFYHMMYSPPTMKNTTGWQYQYVYTPAFTMAVTTELDPELNNLTAEQYDAIDEYNGYGPIHYAVKYNHTPAIRALLELGCNPNLLAADQKQTPMYIAERDELPKSTIALLEAYGAQRSKQADIEKKGAFFSKINITNQIVAEKKKKKKDEEETLAKEKAEKAALVTSAMNRNMQLMQERGQKINEMADRAQELHDGGEEFKSLASQIKEKTMAKKWYQL